VLKRHKTLYSAIFGAMIITTLVMPNTVAVSKEITNSFEHIAKENEVTTKIELVNVTNLIHKSIEIYETICWEVIDYQGRNHSIWNSTSIIANREISDERLLLYNVTVWFNTSDPVKFYFSKSLTLRMQIFLPLNPIIRGAFISTASPIFIFTLLITLFSITKIMKKGKGKIK